VGRLRVRPSPWAGVFAAAAAAVLVVVIYTAFR
jgi:hypothetical protein